MMETDDTKTPAAAIVLAWLVATLPLGWGVYQSVVKSLPLYRPSAVAGK